MLRMMTEEGEKRRPEGFIVSSPKDFIIEKTNKGNGSEKVPYGSKVKINCIGFMNGTRFDKTI